jgi:hypothetical protein
LDLIQLLHIGLPSSHFILRLRQASQKLVLVSLFSYCAYRMVQTTYSSTPFLFFCECYSFSDPGRPSRHLADLNLQEPFGWQVQKQV